MKRLLLLLAVALSFVSCRGGATKKVDTQIKRADCVEVLYFHSKQRCVTCNAIEKLTKEVIDSLNDDKIVMRVIDISQKENQIIADKYEVAWSSLILDRNGKVENLTKTGFGYARHQPQVFKAKLVAAIAKITE